MMVRRWEQFVAAAVLLGASTSSYAEGCITSVWFLNGAHICFDVEEQRVFYTDFQSDVWLSPDPKEWMIALLRKQGRR